MNQSWGIPSAVFIAAVALQAKFSLSSKFSRYFGSMLKTSTYMSFVDLGKSYERVPREKLWGILLEYGAGGCLLRTVESLHPAQTFVSVSGELNHNRSLWVLDSDKDVCCHHSSSQSIWIGSRMTSESTMLALFEDTWSIVYFLMTIWCCLHPLNRVFSMHSSGFLLHETKQKWQLALKSPKYYVSPEIQVSVHCTWVTILCSRWRRSKHVWVIFTSNGRQNKEIDTRIVKADASSASALSLYGIKWELSYTAAKLSIWYLFRCSPMAINLWYMSERVLSQVQAAESSFWEEFTMWHIAT